MLGSQRVQRGFRIRHPQINKSNCRCLKLPIEMTVFSEGLFLKSCCRQSSTSFDKTAGQYVSGDSS